MTVVDFIGTQATRHEPTDPQLAVETVTAAEFAHLYTTRPDVTIERGADGRDYLHTGGRVVVAEEVA